MTPVINDELVIAVAQIMKERGLELMAHAQIVEGGYGYVNINPKDMPTFLRDPVAGIARQFKATAQDLLEYQAEAGVPRCAATTKKGKPCRAGCGSAMDFKLWLKHDKQSYCRVHS